MFQHRRGSILFTATSIIGVFMMILMGTMIYFENAVKRAQNQRWEDVSEQAARSGLDFVLGWGEASIDNLSKLPRSWEMLDGQAMDPIRNYFDTGINAPPLTSVGPTSTNMVGKILGQKAGEYIIGRMGNYLVTFKARVYQYRLSEHMPRQYRIGVIGRVRNIGSNTSTDVDNDEAKGLVAERMVEATVGKEAFSRYAALFDIDQVKNWVPGEEVNGPVHINRGYVDDKPYDDDDVPIKPNDALEPRRSFVRIQTTGSGTFGTVAGKAAYPVFHEAFSVTASSLTGGGPNDNMNDWGSFISVDSVKLFDAGLTDAQTKDMFRAPENQARRGTKAAPIVMDQNIEMPRSSRSRLAFALGVPAGQTLAGLGWFDGLEDGVYTFTEANIRGGAGTYSTGSYPAGCIYVRGNVEIMRMAVQGDWSFYFFQLGYSGARDPGPGTGVRRSYAVKANRLTNQLELIAWDQGSALYGPGGVLEGPPADLTTLGNGFGAAANFSQWAVNVGGEFRMPFMATPKEYSAFPFNGIVFVDVSLYDPARVPGAPEAFAVGQIPITGNIFSLGDPGDSDDGQTKRALGENTGYGTRRPEVVNTVSTHPDYASTRPASKLTIVTAGNIFIQNDLILDACGDDFNAMSTIDQTNFPLQKSRDLLGLVSDKQIVIGLMAPNGATREAPGVVIHAAICALGDPGWDYATNTVPDKWKYGVAGYRGSFTTEGLMTAFPDHLFPIKTELNALPGSFLGDGFDLDPDPTKVTITGLREDYRMVNYSDNTWPPAGGFKSDLTAPHGAGNAFAPAEPRGYPGNPMAVYYGGVATQADNPNINLTTRGRMVVFGSVTQKKRGVVGVGNRSYDKDIRYDRRLQSIAPPLFPTSTNVVMRTSRPFSPKGMVPYIGGGTGKPDMKYMGKDASTPTEAM